MKKKSSARKTSKLPTRIWKFSARFVSKDDEKRAHKIIFGASRYYNKLIEIEKARSAQFQQIRRRYAPELAAAYEELEKLDEKIGPIYREVKEARQQHWRKSDPHEKRRILPPETQKKIDLLRQDQNRVNDGAKKHREAFALLIEPARIELKRRSEEYANGGKTHIKSRANARALGEMHAEEAWHPAWKETSRADNEAHARTIQARANCGLPSGTYLKIDEAVKRAKDDSSPLPPKLHHFSGNGLLVVQLDDPFVNLVRGKLSIRTAPHDPTKGTKDQSRVKIVQLDQSIPRGEKQKITCTVVMHRSPPPDAVVKWGTLVVLLQGQRTRVEFQLTMEHASFNEQKRPSGLRASEHIKIGWARTDDGTRVAQWPGGQVVVSDKLLAQTDSGRRLGRRKRICQRDHADGVKGGADKLFFVAKNLLRRAMKKGPHRLTAWHQMLSDDRRAMMHRVCTQYAEHVFGADVAKDMWRTWVAKQLRQPRSPSHMKDHRDLYAMPSVFRELFSLNNTQAVAFWCLVWAKKDAHLKQYAYDDGRRFEQRRDHFFRLEAIRISTEFAAVTVDMYNIAELKKLDPLTMPGEFPRDRAQHQLHEAAPGRFREILCEVMGGRCTPCERLGDEEKTGGAREENEEAAE